MPTRFLLIAALLLVTGAVSAVPPLNTDDDGVAIGGYDTVAFFTEAEPVSGNRRFRHQWGGGTWWFASAGNRDLFAADPARYAPQYGGHCAAAMTGGKIAYGSPVAWTIRDDRLFLNYDTSVRDRWFKDVDSKIRRADENWAAKYAQQ